eukprot:31304-Pelagococcus_subviridis.AAC.18
MIPPAQLQQRRGVHSNDVPPREALGHDHLGGELLVPWPRDPRADVRVVPPHGRDDALDPRLHDAAVVAHRQVPRYVLLHLVVPRIALLHPADHPDRLERRHRVLRVHRRGGHRADDPELRVRADEALHEHSREVRASVRHVHVPGVRGVLRSARAVEPESLMLQPTHPHALLQRVQRRVDLRRLLPLIRAVMHVVLLALGPRAIDEREPPGVRAAVAQRAREPQHRVRAR